LWIIRSELIVLLPSEALGRAPPAVTRKPMASQTPSGPCG
jgi:hypothetical protein